MRNHSDESDAAVEPDYSRVAHAYVWTRPRYPPELFAFIAAVVKRRDVVWDCATGSGQAAVDLAEHFERVIATDLSPEQVGEAVPHPRVTYRVASAEHSGLPDRSVDLVTVASGVHWFELEAFFAEARRVLRPGGVLAAWTYHVGHVEPPFDDVFGRFYTEVVSPYFAPGAKLVDARYETLELPGEPIEAPSYRVRATWSFEQALAFVESWSGTQRYIERRGESPIPLISGELGRAWGDRGRSRELHWPLYLRVSRVWPENEP